MESPKLLREALHRATLEVGNLRQAVPGAKVGQVLDSLDRIEGFWEKQDTGQFPLNHLVKEVNAIRIELSEAYAGELDLPIERGSLVLDQITHLDHRIRIYSESIVLGPVFEGLERRLQRLERVLPPTNYAIKPLLGELRLGFDPPLRQRIESAFTRFEEEQYEFTLQECGKANEILFSILKACVHPVGASAARNSGSALREIRKRLENGKTTAWNTSLFQCSIHYIIFGIWPLMNGL